MSLCLISIAFLLSGCASPLTGKEVTAEIHLGEWAYALVDDEIKIRGNVTIAGENDSKYSLALQAKDGKAGWTTTSTKNNLAGDTETEFAVKVTEEKDYKFRFAVLAGNENVIATSQEGKVVVKDLKVGITKLDYNERIACQKSERKCFEFILNKDYPGLHSFSKNEKEELFSKYRWEYVSSAPNLDSIQPDSTWLFPANNCKFDRVSLDISKPLAGRTFILQTTGASPTSYHVTYLKGEFYSYPYFC